MKRVFAPGCAPALYKPDVILIPPYQAFSTWSSQTSSSGFSRR
jgi:hypothetical protein